MSGNQESLGFTFQHVSSLFARRSDTILQTYLDIGYSQYKIMLALASSVGLRQIDIAIDLGQTEASISRQVKIMENDGLVRIVTNPSNRREHVISLTQKGLHTYSKATQLLNRAYQPLFSNLTSEQARILRETLLAMDAYLN